MTNKAAVRLETFESFTELPDTVKFDVSTLISLGKLSTEDVESYEGVVLARDVNDSTLLGCVGVEYRAPNAYMESLVVHPAARRQHIGEYLTGRLFTDFIAGNDSLDSLTALTLFWNNQFYSNIGFTQINAREAKMADDIAARTKHRYCTAWRRYKPLGLVE